MKQSVQERREASAVYAKSLYERLMALPRSADMSNQAWTKNAGVNTSFFTNLRNGSQPGVGNLKSVLDVVGISLSTFFADDDHKLDTCATRDRMAGALDVLLAQMPSEPAVRATWLADALMSLPTSTAIMQEMRVIQKDS